MGQDYGIWKWSIFAFSTKWEPRVCLLQQVHGWERGHTIVLKDLFCSLEFSWQKKLGVYSFSSPLTQLKMFLECDIGSYWGKGSGASDLLQVLPEPWGSFQVQPQALSSPPAGDVLPYRGFSLKYTKFLSQKEVSSHFEESVKSEAPGPYITLCKYS